MDFMKKTILFFLFFISTIFTVECSEKKLVPTIDIAKQDESNLKEFYLERLEELKKKYYQLNGVDSGMKERLELLHMIHPDNNEKHKAGISKVLEILSPKDINKINDLLKGPSIHKTWNAFFKIMEIFQVKEVYPIYAEMMRFNKKIKKKKIKKVEIGHENIEVFKKIFSSSDETEKIFIPESITVSYFEKNKNSLGLVKEEFNLKQTLNIATTCKTLLDLASLQYNLAILAFKKIKFDSPTEEFTYARIYDPVQNDTIYKDYRDIIQAFLGLFHMLNYIKATEKKLNNSDKSLKRVNRSIAKSVIGIRHFLTELTYHPKNHNESGPEFDKKFVESFDGTPDSIKQAKKELEVNFSCLFQLLRFFPENLKNEEFLNSFVCNNHYYCEKTKCPRCKNFRSRSKKEKKDENYRQISDLYCPADMDSKIRNMNREKAIQMRELFEYLPTRNCLNPYLISSKKIYDPKTQDKLISYYYGLYDFIEF